jgi:hypothetical protein
LKVELLYFDGCPNYQELLPQLRELLADLGTEGEVGLRRIETEDAARGLRFLGSPTVRVDGVDVDPGAGEREDFGLKCRLYSTRYGLRGVPPGEWIRAALTRSAPDGESLRPSLNANKTV